MWGMESLQNDRKQWAVVVNGDCVVNACKEEIFLFYSTSTVVVPDCPGI